MFGLKKNKNQIGILNPAKARYSKNTRVLIMTVIVVIFVVGVSMHLFKKKNSTAQVKGITEKTSDQILGWWYRQYFGESVCDKDICKPDSDPDQDKLNNAQEFYYHTNPVSSYTVGDTMNDGQLVAAGFDPSRKGRMTFDSVVQSDNVVNEDVVNSESLVMDKDIVKIISELTSTENIKLPEINDLTIKISHENSKKAILDYADQVNSVISKYFPDSIANTITNTMASGDTEDMDNLSNKAARVVVELKSIVVPSDALALHKDYLGIFQLFPLVVNIPPKSAIEDQTDPASNLWYDQTQAYMYLMQQRGIEIKKLDNKYK